MAHFLGQHDDAVVFHATADEGAADAIIAGRGPDQGMRIGIDFAQQLLFQQDGVGRPNFVAAGGEAFAVDHNDLGVYAG